MNDAQSLPAMLSSAIAAVPAGAWAVGVSGGADSVALLHLLRQRSDLRLYIVHLNHETRGVESDADAQFVTDLAREWRLAVTVARRNEVEAAEMPRNLSARYRAARLELFRRVVAIEKLDGVILAHHADDQAETIFHRLLRGSGAMGLGGMHFESHVGGLLILRPLLSVPRHLLRDELVRCSIAWREDATNSSPRYLRNRLRRVLRDHPGLGDSLLQLGAECGQWREWLDRIAPRLPETFAAQLLQELPGPLARQAVRRWLRQRGCPSDELNQDSVQRLLMMATDAASPPRQLFPGPILVRRRAGMMFTESEAWS